RLGDIAGQARALAGLALGLSRCGRLDDAEVHFRQALDLFTDLGDLIRQAFTHWGLADVPGRGAGPPTRSPTTSRPSRCTVGRATRTGRPSRSTGSAGATPWCAATRGRSRSARSPSSCTRNSATGR